MSPSKRAVPLARSQVKHAAAVLARAFQDDPFFTFVLPDPLKRARLLPWLFAKFIRYGIEYGEVLTTPSIEGLAIWLGPQNATLALAGILRTGIFLFPLKLTWREFDRSTRLANFADRLHKQAVSGRHWYLFELGTQPELQGQGIGRALLQPVLAQADREGLACYLDTYNGKNLVFYERNGFAVAGHGRAGPASPPVWGMLRKPA